VAFCGAFLYARKLLRIGRGEKETKRTKKTRQKEGEKESKEEANLISRNHNARTRLTLTSRGRIGIIRVENIKKDNSI